MKKIYILVMLLGVTFSAISAQNTKKIEKKQLVEAPKSENLTIYFVDGVRVESATQFFKIKTEDIYSMNVVSDQTEITKKYARKGEKLKSVIVVETVKRAPTTESVTSDKTASRATKN